MALIQTDTTVLDLALASANAGSFTYHATNQHLRWDQRSQALFGVEEKSCSGTWQDWATLLPGTPYSLICKAIADKSDNRQSVDISYQLDSSGGSKRHIRTVAKIAVDNDGNVVSISGLHIDQTQQVRAAKSLKVANQQSAAHCPVDTLTKVLSKTAVLRDCKTVFDIADRYNRDFSLVWIALDNAEQIADEMGELAHRNALVKMAHTLRTKTRSVDILGRVDKNAFLLVLPETTPADAETVAHCLRGYIQNLSAADGTNTLPLSCSCGVSGISSGQSANLDTLLDDVHSQATALQLEGGNKVSTSNYDWPLATSDALEQPMIVDIDPMQQLPASNDPSTKPTLQ